MAATVETMLAPLGGRGVVLWSDERVAVDAAWNLELQRAIARADAALVLVSPELLASEMILREELPALRGRDIPIGFVHVRASLVSQVHGLSDVGWLHNPAQPLHGATNPDGQIVTICERLVGLLPPREAHEPEPAGGSLPRAGQVQPPRRGIRMGRIYDAPPAVTGELERGELDGLREAVLRGGDNIRIARDTRSIGLHGQGGIGKTVLAAALARDHEIRRHFPGGRLLGNGRRARGCRSAAAGAAGAARSPSARTTFGRRRRCGAARRADGKAVPAHHR